MHAQTEIWTKERLCFPEPCEHKASWITEANQLRPAATEMMDKYNVVLAAISESKEKVLGWTKDDPERYLPGIIIGNPADVDLAELRSLIESGRIRLMGEIGSQYNNIPIDDPSLDPILALAYEFDLPVLVHCAGLGGSKDFPINLGNPLRIAKVLRKYPNLRIYLENAAWPFLEEVTSLMYQYPSVHADVSTILHLTPRPVAYAYLKGLIDNGLEKRIMFGSDQMIWPETIGETIEAIQNAPFLSTAQKADILYNNAARFLRLSEEEIAKHHGK